jgi:two-component system CheB/CheR fusion protein
MLTDLIGRFTRMNVQEAVNRVTVAGNSVSIVPPNRDIALEGGVLRPSQPSERRSERLPIDSFFRSLAREEHERAISIVLSGTGSDGTLGVRAVKGEGGMVMAQDPDSTEHSGMPRSAIATGMVDHVLAPQDMPAQLVGYVRHAFDRSRPPETELPADGSLRGLTALLRANTGHDFSQYKVTTLIRRMQRRMALRQIECPSDYLRYAKDNPDEVDRRFRDLLIGVTNFFRDPEAFKALEEKVIPRLFQGRNPGEHCGRSHWASATSPGPGQGSEFIVRLARGDRRPLDRGPSAESRSGTPDVDSGAGAPLVLVVDDNVDAADSMALMLRMHGYDVVTAHNAGAGFDYHLVKPGPPETVLQRLATAIHRHPTGAVKP